MGNDKSKKTVKKQPMKVGEKEQNDRNKKIKGL